MEIKKLMKPIKKLDDEIDLKINMRFGETKRTTVWLPEKIENIVDEIMKDSFDSAKDVIIYALSKYFKDNPINYICTKKNWNYSMNMPTIIRDEINKRIPFEFASMREAIILAVLNMVKKEQQSISKKK